MTEGTKRPEELIQQLEQFPEDWKLRVDSFASSYLGLKLGLHSNGDPVLKRFDSRVARVGYREKDNRFLFASTDRRIPSLDATADIPIDAPELVERLVKFANGE